MKTIVCYGDSNTWGYMPQRERPSTTAENRFPWGVRWTSQLQIALGADWHIVEAGVNGRTSVFEAPFEAHRNGAQHIDACLMAACPVDLVILMLGTNDVKPYYAQNVYGICQGIRSLAERIQNSHCGLMDNAPKLLLVAPIRLNDAYRSGWLGAEFGPDAVARSAAVSRGIEAIAAELHAFYLNASEYIEADCADGIHMNAEGHARMADLILDRVRDILAAP